MDEAKVFLESVTAQSPPNVVEQIVEVLSTYGADKGLLLQCCLALTRFCSAPVESTQDPNRAAVSNTDIVQLLLKYATDMENVELMQALMCALKLIARNYTNSLLIGKNGGVSLILDVIRKHCDNADLQVDACWALINVALNEPNKQLIARYDGIPAIMQVMKLHPNRADVQLNAVWALKNLATETANKRIIRSAGGLQLIVEISRLHRDNVEVLCQVCGALGNAVLDTELTDSDTGIFEAVLDMIRHNMKSPQVMIKACKVLQNLAMNARNKSIIGRLGGISVLISVIRNNIDAPDVLAQAFWALINLAVDPSNRTMVGREPDGIPLILDAMRRHQKNSEVQVHACWALVNIGLDMENQRLICEHGGLELILAIMSYHWSEPNVQIRSCKALHSVSMSVDNAKAICKLGGITVLIKVMSRNLQNAALQTAAWGAMQSLISQRPHVHIAVTQGLVDVMYHVLRNKEMDETLMYYIGIAAYYVSKHTDKYEEFASACSQHPHTRQAFVMGMHERAGAASPIRRAFTSCLGERKLMGLIMRFIEPGRAGLTALREPKMRAELVPVLMKLLERGNQPDAPDTSWVRPLINDIESADDANKLRQRKAST